MRIRIFLSIAFFLLAHSFSALAAEQVYFYHTDPAGTPLSMTNSSGTVVWKADYKPFGEENSTTGPAANDRRFVGKEKDEETGLSYFGARYENAKIGRFIAPDPVRAVDPKASKTNEKMLANPQRLNTYAYALNNPYSYMDPDGRDGILIHYRGYPVNTGYGFKLPLGHAAVVAVDPNTGNTRYFEYGRYDKEQFGVVRAKNVPDVVIGKDGKPTEKSLINLYDYASKNYGHDSAVDATYYKDADYKKIINFATDRTNDKERSPYRIAFPSNNCKTFAKEAIDAGRRK